MNNLTYKSYFRFIAYMLIISTFLPILKYNLPPIVRSHHIWTLLWFISLFIFYPKIFGNNLLKFVLACGAVMLLLLNSIWIDIGELNPKRIINEFYQVTVAISVIVYFRMRGDYKGLANLTKWALFFLFITAILSFTTFLINPTYARDLIGVSSVGTNYEAEMIRSYAKYGGGGYSFASALVCMFPVLIYFYKNPTQSYFNKNKLMIIIIVFLVALFVMQLFANILLAITVIALSWLGVSKAKPGFILLLLFTSLFLLIPSHIYIALLQSIGALFKTESELYFKFNDMATFISYGGSFEGTGIGGRAERYSLLWDLFLRNPVFGHSVGGAGYKNWFGGAHLYWMNKLAVYGLLGTIPFLIIIYKSIKMNLRFFNNEFVYYFLLSMFSIIALGAMKLLVGRELWYTFFIILPGMYYLPLLKKTKTHSPG